MKVLRVRSGPIMEPLDEIWRNLIPDHERGKRRKVGRPRNWRKDVALILDADHVVDERRCSDSEAIRILVTSPRFAKRWRGENKRTLQNRLSAARKDQSIAFLVRGARKAAHARGLDLRVVERDEGTIYKSRQVAEEEKCSPTETERSQNATSQPPKPNDPTSEAELTAEERDILSQARAILDRDSRKKPASKKLSRKFQP
ncbi:hypothetical protein NKJ59_04805 [Mesorhizobium australicum]|uniref:hypothetical protein n=1 Tax=Mesorhizobium australicum TaxID=536018 RepID=UPI00333A4B47